MVVVCEWRSTGILGSNTCIKSVFALKVLASVSSSLPGYFLLFAKVSFAPNFSCQ